MSWAPPPASNLLSAHHVSQGDQLAGQAKPRSAPSKRLRDTRWEAWEIEGLQHLYIDLGLGRVDVAVLLGRTLRNVKNQIQRQRMDGLPRKNSSLWLHPSSVRMEAILGYNRRRGCSWAVISRLPGLGQSRHRYVYMQMYNEREYLSGWAPEDDAHFANLAWRDFEVAWKTRLDEALGRKYTKFVCERRLILLRSDPVSDEDIAPAPDESAQDA